jgi:hypothetical protein
LEKRVLGEEKPFDHFGGIVNRRDLDVLGEGPGVDASEAIAES